MIIRRLSVFGAAATSVLCAIVWRQLPAIAAGGLLHPARRAVATSPPAGCADASVRGAGVTLSGWRCTPSGEPRGTIIYLHGIADNRTSATGVIARFRARMFDVLAFDSRAHGDSGGDVCTYGYYEREDLRRIVSTARTGPVVLIGTSLGAAIALQEAPGDPRITGIVAAEVFSDLRTVATERAPRLLPSRVIPDAFAEAEREGSFVVDAVSPLRAAAHIHVPVLLIHGADDRDTPPDHSRRVFDGLAGPKQLVLVPGAHHNESLNAVWPTVEQWVDSVVADSNRVTAVRFGRR